MGKSTPSSPRRFMRGEKVSGWLVDLANDDQANCKGCGQAIYWLWIQPAKGKVKRMPVSEAMSENQGKGYALMASHYADCPKAEKFRR